MGCRFPSFCLHWGGGGGGISTTLGDETLATSSGGGISTTSGDEALATSSLLHKEKKDTLGHHITDDTHHILLLLLIDKAFSFYSPANHDWVILSANTE